ncbi:eosinophil peroxidase-like isoform X1 [Dermatophagoides pteronyssinus]|uniref:eosinophil peroxidase-like isoform X1 n=1 Tax=Dermatophagoides pteronyssinus TaxID=6956 RepID=UPI003F6801EF
MVTPFIQYLNLSHNLIRELKQKHFDHLPLLNVLDLSNNQIQTIPDRVFAGLGSLKKLYLNNNRIKIIEHYGFRNLHELDELYLYSNSLDPQDDGFDWNIFKELINLKYLSIFSQKNDLEKICNSKINKKSLNFCLKLNQTLNIENSNVKPVQHSNVSSTKVSTIHLPDKINNKHKSSEKKERIVYEHQQNRTNLLEIITNGSTPILTKVPKSIYRIKLGSKLELSCEAEGNPKPTLKWIRFGRTFSFNSTIIIEKIQPDDDGYYECQARNRNGKASKEIRIIIVGCISSESNLNQHRNLLQQIIEASKYSKRIELGNLITLNTTDVLKFFDLTRLLIAYSDNRTQFDALNLYESNHSLTATQATVMGNFTGCVGGARFETFDCFDDNSDEFSEYYSITGICNNRKNPKWGASVEPFLRLLPANYADGLVKPIGWFDNEDDWWMITKTKRPNPRKVTKELLSTEAVTNDELHNHLLMQFGQFLDHDLTFAALSDNRNLLENDLVDCERTCHENVEPCYSIFRPDSSKSTINDYDKCIELKRSAEYCGTGYTSVVFGQLIRREQVNLITSFIDGSQIYGNNFELFNYLRHPNQENSHLLNSTIISNQTYLPKNDNYQLLLSMDCQMEPERSNQECFLAGDHRANEQLGLLIFHNLWLRNHNLLARKFRLLRPDWTNDKIFYETRKIISAQLQIITYRDWLPLIIGSKGMKMLGKYNGYDETINPSISNVFATAAMRFGHTLVNKNLIRKFANLQHHHDDERKHSKDDGTKMHQAFFRPDQLSKTEVFDSVLLGLARTPLKKSMPEQAISDELTEHLFRLSRYQPLDLASINIQRGRDHALPDYNQWRKFCGLKMATNFDDLKYEIKNQEIRKKLQKLYGHPDNVDLYVAGLMENSDSDAKIGPTFRCLLVDQFRRLRNGDRFFYLNKNIFTDEQLKQLETTTTLSAIICQNSDNIKTIIKKSFHLPNDNQSWIECDQLPKIDLTKW